MSKLWPVVILFMVFTTIFSGAQMLPEIPRIPREATNPQEIPQVLFRDLVIYNHFDLDAARKRTIGLEVEIAGLSSSETMAALIGELGGVDGGSSIYGTEMADFIKDTSIGAVRLEPVNLTRILNRWRETHPKSVPNSKVTAFVAGFDRQFGRLEVVTEPISYDQVKLFSKAMDAVGIAGAKGASNLMGRFISIQPNIGIDHQDAMLIKNIAANYYRNKKAIRDDIKPIVLRHQFLGAITKRFMRKLDDPNWSPSITELFDWYSENSNDKLSRVQLYNALITNDENYVRMQDTVLGKARPQRPVAEFREANTVMSDKGDPTRGSRAIMRETDFALSIVEASEKTGSLTLDLERQLFFENMAKQKNPPTSPEEIPALRDFLEQKYYVALKVRPDSNADVVFSNPNTMAKWGIKGTAAEIDETIKSRYAVQVDNSNSATGEPTDDPSAPIATSHNDGAGGVGDGRALTVDQVNGMALSLKGGGLTPYQVQNYAMWLGLHTGGKDGMMSYKEGIKTWIKGEVLATLGINSERAVAVIDNKSIFTKEGTTAPSAQLLREIPGGAIRNSHLNVWDPIQTRRGLEFLKAIASAEYGRKFTDTAYVTFDAIKTGELAARMQDFYLIHGALAKGNVLAYPGLVDIAAMSFLDAPDPEFASFAYLSRFGNQANTLQRLMSERKKAYAKTNKELLNLDENKIFEEAYQRELAILAIMRLGFSRNTSETLFSQNYTDAMNYGQLIWKAQFGHLETDIDMFQALLPEYFKNYNSRDILVKQVAREVIEKASEKERVLLESRREKLAQIKNTLHGNYSQLGQKEAVRIIYRGMSFIRKGLALPGENLSLMISRANLREKMLENLNFEMDTLIKSAFEAKSSNLDVKPAILSIENFLSEFKEKISVSDICDFSLSRASGD